jgi:cytochrome c biogenesis protein CcdA
MTVKKNDPNSEFWDRGRSSPDDKEPVQFSPIKLDENNKAFYMRLLCILGLTVIFTVLGSIVLACQEKNIPNALVAIGSVAVGALGSLFTHNR